MVKTGKDLLDADVAKEKEKGNLRKEKAKDQVTEKIIFVQLEIIRPVRTTCEMENASTVDSKDIWLVIRTVQQGSEMLTMQ